MMSNLIQKIDQALFFAEAKQKAWRPERREIEYYQDWWKDPYHPEYSRAYAEDCLMRTLGPMRPDSKWSEAEWDPRASKREGKNIDYPPPEGCAPPEGYEPGGRAPTWTETEVTIALAGDPSYSSGPKSFMSSPLWKMARRVGSDRRKGEALYELYALGLSRLAELLKPGMDQAKSPFRVYAENDIIKAMQNGYGSTKELNAAKTAINTIIATKDPNEIYEIIDKIQDPYRDSDPGAGFSIYDKAPGNPYSRYSAVIYDYGTKLLYAMQEGDIEYEAELREELAKILDKLQDVTAMSLGTSTGLFKAVSQPRSVEKPYETGYKWLLNAKNADDARMILNPRSATFKNKANPYDEGNEKHTDFIMQKAQEMLDAFEVGDMDTVYRIKDEAAAKAPKVVRTGITSIDAPIGDDGYSAAETLAAKEESAVSVDIVNEVLKLGLKGDIIPVDILASNKDLIIPKLQEMHAMVLTGGLTNLPKPKDLKVDFKKINTPFSAMEYRVLIRLLGEMASNYPGKGTMRANLDVIRDAPGWWKAGEDPEIEPIPDENDTWESSWVRNGFKPQRSIDINAEFTDEALEFISFGIQSVHAQRILAGDKLSNDGVINKQTMNNYTNGSYAKMLLILVAYKAQLGQMYNEDIDKTDTQLIYEGAYKIARILSRFTVDDVFVPVEDLGRLYRASKLRKIR